MYYLIFFTNLVRILGERKMSLTDLSEKSGVSKSFLSDLKNGWGNPSLSTLEKISVALEVPLSLLLETTDLAKEDLDLLRAGGSSYLPPGHDLVTAVLPEHQAFIVRKWAAETQARQTAKSKS